MCSNDQARRVDLPGFEELVVRVLAYIDGCASHDARTDSCLANGE